MSERSAGVLLRWIEDRGSFGFIAPDNGDRDIFVSGDAFSDIRK